MINNVKNYRKIFKNVFCEKESLTNVHYLYEGYIVTETQEGENHEAEELSIIKEKITDAFFCVNCNKEKRSSQNDSILERKDCGISRGYHFVAYNKFDYTLATFVTSKDYNEANVEKVIKNILNGIISLHEQKIFHYNINPDVIMIDQECRVKFLDFFLSRELKDRANKPVVPLSFHFDPNDYTSPELLIFRKSGIDFNNEAPDMFSISCCIFFIYTLFNPFDKRYSHTSEISKKDFKIIYQRIDYILLLDEYKKPLLEDLIKDTINYESSERLCPIKVLEHPFFWDCEKISQFFKENIEKIKNPNEYLKGKNLYDGRYEKLPNAADQQDLKYILKKFPTLMYDLYETNKNHIDI